MKSFSNKILNFFLQKVLFLLHFGPCQNYELCRSCRRKSLETFKRVLSTGEPCTCEYVTLLRSFHRGALSIHWYIAQNFQPTFSMSILFRCLFRTDIFRQCFIGVFIYIFPLMLLLISSFQIHYLELARHKFAII